MILADLGPAPDFEAADFEGRPVRLSDHRGKRHVFLVFLRTLS